MASIQDDILKEFYRRLSETEGFTEARVQQLRGLLSGSTKPKSVDLIKAFSEKPTEVLP